MFRLIFQVVGYEPRPLLKITPPSSASDTRLKVYNFIEAVKSLPTAFTKSELEFIFKKINPKLCGQLRSLFICLSDDEYRKSRPKAPPSATEQDEAGPDVEPLRGTEPEGTERPESQPQVPATKSGKSNKGRTQKRGASSPPDETAPAKK